MLPIIIESTYFTLYAYPLFMGMAWGIGFYLTQYIFEKNNLDSSLLFKLFIGLFLSSWLGAKLVFLMVSSNENFNQYLLNDSFWLGGGFVFYGGLILGLMFYFLYSYLMNYFPFSLSKYLLPGLIFGHAVGRIGCFFTGCCFGSSCNLPWALHLNGEMVHPVQIYEALGLIVIGFYVTSALKKEKDNIELISIYLMSYSFLRFFIEFFRGDKNRGLFLNLISTSQLISLFIILILCGMFIYKKLTKKISQ